MALIPLVAMDSVVAIGIKNEDDGDVCIGTGFIVGRPPSDSASTLYTTYLVTNKHVICGLKNCFLRFNPNSNEKARDFPLVLTDDTGKITWVGHPDPVIDVAVISINVNFLKEKENMSCSFSELDKVALNREEMIHEGLNEGDFVYVLGFPMNLIGSERNHVIVRSGVIARIKPYLEGFSKDFLIDSSVFPGNSGGPVISKPENIAMKDTKQHASAYLIGMVQSYIPYRDIAISLQTKEVRSISVENSGLASVVPTEYILETVELAHSRSK